VPEKEQVVVVEHGRVRPFMPDVGQLP